VNIPHDGCAWGGYLVCDRIANRSQPVHRLPALPSTARLGKWCACAVLLLLPGTFLALPLIWIVRRWRPGA
jgi:hypothetical protein